MAELTDAQLEEAAALARDVGVDFGSACEIVAVAAGTGGCLPGRTA